MLIGSPDEIVIKDWYFGNAYHIEQFESADGMRLQSGRVEALVTAMAVFEPPAENQTSLPEHYLSALSPVFATSWSPMLATELQAVVA